MWSDSVVIFLFSALIFVTVKIYHVEWLDSLGFGFATAASGLIVGALIVTRAIPIVLIPFLALLFFGHLSRGRFVSYLAGVPLISASIVSAMLASTQIQACSPFAR